MRIVMRALNGLLGRWVRRTVRISVGQRSLVKWWGLRDCGRGRISVGSDSIVRCRFNFDSPNGNISIGDRCFVGASHLVCHTAIAIGNDVIMSWGVTVVDHDSHALDWNVRQHDVAHWMKGEKRWDGVGIASVKICNRAWIGFGASILKGVTIGEGAVVGANSVVTRNVPPFTVVAGNPARVVRDLTPPTPNP